MRRVLPFVLLAGCFGPFSRGSYDNRPNEAVEIARVHDDGKIELTDGRTVRIFGLHVPAERLRLFMGKRVSVEALLPTDPPAVELVVWRKTGYCGYAVSSWDPFDSPLEEFLGSSVVANGGRLYPIRESDLDDPAAPQRLVKRLREDAAARDAELARWERAERQ